MPLEDAQIVGIRPPSSPALLVVDSSQAIIGPFTGPGTRDGHLKKASFGSERVNCFPLTVYVYTPNLPSNHSNLGGFC